MVGLIDPLRSPRRRTVAIARAVAEREGRVRVGTDLRFGILGLLAAGGDPGQAADALFAEAEALAEARPWWSPLRSEVRFCIAAQLVATGVGRSEFEAAFETCRGYFRAEGLPKSELHEALACLVLMASGPEVGLTARRVTRLAAVYGALRRRHPYLIGRGHYAAAALLATDDGSIEEIVERVEARYRILHELRFHRGGQLELAAELLCFAEASDRTLGSRFRLLFDAFRRAGARLDEDRYDELALLASIDMPSAELVRRVLSNSDFLEDELKHAPSGERGFELATAATLLGLARSSAGSGALRGDLGLSQVVALLQARNAGLLTRTLDRVGALVGPSGRQPEDREARWPVPHVLRPEAVASRRDA